MLRGLRYIVIDECHAYRGVLVRTWPWCCDACCAWRATWERHRW